MKIEVPCEPLDWLVFKEGKTKWKMRVEQVCLSHFCVDETEKYVVLFGINDNSENYDVYKNGREMCTSCDPKKCKYYVNSNECTLDDDLKRIVIANGGQTEKSYKEGEIPYDWFEIKIPFDLIGKNKPFTVVRNKKRDDQL